MPKPEGNGWKDIGYHFVVRKTGQIEMGRPLVEQGAHVRGYNPYSIGICLSGGRKGANDFTDRQLESLELLVGGLRRKFPRSIVMGHNDLTKSKPCPNFDVREWWDRCNGRTSL